MLGLGLTANAYSSVGGDDIYITAYWWAKPFRNDAAREADLVNSMIHEMGRLQGVVDRKAEEQGDLTSFNNVYNWDAVIETLCKYKDVYRNKPSK